MEPVWLGIVAIVVGALLCFWGACALRGLIALWGALAGFVAGGLLASALGAFDLWGGAAGWILSVLVALLFGVLAYVFYAVSVVITVAAMGFSLGVGLAGLADVGNETILLVVGVAAAVAFAGLALAMNLPRLLLVILSAAAGASILVTGVLLLIGERRVTDASVQSEAPLAPLWYVVYAALTVAGIVVQSRSSRRSSAGQRTSGPR